eukprot:GHRR01025837.1.p1 GENE.GHRR01025837.1~~GHRR01025837.1.p1  ORF type:complete len:352 (+),score=92.35 GHRR01025837.1:376-1431(+)
MHSSSTIPLLHSFSTMSHVAVSLVPSCCDPAVKGYVHTTGQVSIYYEVHGLEPGMTLVDARDRPKVVMVMGLACPCNAWRWQLQDLVRQQKMNPGADATSYSAVGFEPDKQQHHNQHQQPQPQFICGHVTQLIANSSCQPLQQHWQQQHQHTHRADQEQRMLVCVLDNRGVGNSSSPTDTAAYSSRLMAEDVLAVMDHLRWDQAHILGFSMGGMVAQALAVAAPGRVQSLTLLSTSAGGWQIIPSSWTGLKTAVKMITARCAARQAQLRCLLVLPTSKSSCSLVSCAGMPFSTSFFSMQLQHTDTDWQSRYIGCACGLQDLGCTSMSQPVFLSCKDTVWLTLLSLVSLQDP